MSGADRAAGFPAAWWLRSAVAVLMRPSLWWAAIEQVFRLARRGWWHRAPFLPLPDAAYVRFRLQTAYGDQRAPEPADVVTYLHWCRAWPRFARR